MKVPFGKAAVVVVVIYGAIDITCRLLIPLEKVSFRAWEAMSRYQSISLYRPSGPFMANKYYENYHTYGELAHIGNLKQLRQYRKERLRTDSCGNRNAPDKLKQLPPDILMVGTSFTAGSGVDDDDTLPVQLERMTGLKTYNAAGLLQPDSWIDPLISRLKMTKGLVMLEHIERWDIKEGSTKTSYICSDEQEPNIWAFINGLLWRMRYVSPLRLLGKKVINLFQNGTILPTPNKDEVLIGELNNGQKTLFSSEEIESITRKRNIDASVRVLSRIASLLKEKGLDFAVLLVPNKYTIYQSLLKKSLSDEIDGEYFLQLEQKLLEKNIMVVNLTNIFKQFSIKLITENKYLYWLDDTHWNPIGIKIASEELIKRLGLPKSNQ
ncbi:MAG: hypothetical protein AAB116_25630 [Candidatus Poribacteria bacterium]